MLSGGFNYSMLTVEICLVSHLTVRIIYMFLLTMLCTFQAVFYAWISYGLVHVLNSYNCNLNVKFCFMHFLIQVSYIHYQIPVTILGMFLLDR